MESPERYPQPLQCVTHSTTNPNLPPSPLPLQSLVRFTLSAPPALPRGPISAAAMEARFRQAVMKLAHDNANGTPVTGRHESLIDRTLAEFFAELRTPDHPPYSAMIQRAIRELKEKGGSTEESISNYLKKEYNDLPWAHNTLLRHHLGNLCVDGEIIVLRKRFYSLAAANPSPQNKNGPKENLKRKQRAASGRKKSKRRKKAEKQEDDEGSNEDKVIHGQWR